MSRVFINWGVWMNFLAFDHGAESGQGQLESGALAISEIYRFRNDPVQFGNELRWDILRLWREMKKALEYPLPAQA